MSDNPRRRSFGRAVGVISGPFRLPLWVSITVWPLTALTLTLAILPRAKAIFIAAIWAMKAPGFE